MINPKIRFKRDDGSEYPEWDTLSLCDIGNVVTGNTPSTKDKSNYGGEYLFCGPGDLGSKSVVTNADKSLTMKGFSLARKIPKGSIMVTCIGSTIGKMAIAGKELATNQQINSVVLNEDFKSEFIYNALLKTFPRYLGLISSQAVPIINKSEFEKVQLNVPCLEEQQKIADFLSSVDEILSASEAEVKNLEEQKKGVMQKIFSQEVRFKADDGSEYPEWKEKTFHETGEFFGGLSGKCKDDFEHGDDVFITYMNVFSNIFADESMVTAVSIAPGEKQRKIQFGDIMFTQSSETVEEVGMSSVWIHDSNPYMNSFCMCLRPYSLNDISPWYMGYALRSELVRKQIIREGQGISRINLASSRIQNVTYPLPCLEEQQKIADFLSSFDEAIEQVKNELDKWKELKKGLLQQMFV